MDIHEFPFISIDINGFLWISALGFVFLILFSREKQETGFLVALPLVWSYDALIIFSEH